MSDIFNAPAPAPIDAPVATPAPVAPASDARDIDAIVAQLDSALARIAALESAPAPSAVGGDVERRVGRLEYAAARWFRSELEEFDAAHPAA